MLRRVTVSLVFVETCVTVGLEKHPVRAVHVSALYQLVIFVAYSFTSTN